VVGDPINLVDPNGEILGYVATGIGVALTLYVVKSGYDQSAPLAQKNIDEHEKLKEIYRDKPLSEAFQENLNMNEGRSQRDAEIRDIADDTARNLPQAPLPSIPTTMTELIVEQALRQAQKPKTPQTQPCPCNN